MKRSTCIGLSVCIITMLVVGMAVGQTQVSNVAALRQAVSDAKPGDVITIAPGSYPGGITLTNLRGTAEQPIVITGDPENPPTFKGGSGLHLVNPAYVHLRHIIVEDSTANGINIDDGGTMQQSAVGIKLLSVTVRGNVPKGNLDGIKMSGVRAFELRDCVIQNWGDGGSGIDMVGCADGRIVGCSIIHQSDTSTSSGIQTKGGTKDVVIERNWFFHAGRRGVNIGGSTGEAFFRPALERTGNTEATRITIGGNTFVGSEAPVAFVTSTDCIVESNLFYQPGKWAIRILQEQPPAPGKFESCSRGVFRKNVVVWVKLNANMLINIGPNTKPDTFTFERNVWSKHNDAAGSRPTLPVVERDGVYGLRVRLNVPANTPYRPIITDERLARRVGPGSWQSDSAPERLEGPPAP